MAAVESVKSCQSIAPTMLNALHGGSNIIVEDAVEETANGAKYASTPMSAYMAAMVVNGVPKHLPMAAAPAATTAYPNLPASDKFPITENPFANQILRFRFNKATLDPELASFFFDSNDGKNTPH